MKWIYNTSTGLYPSIYVTNNVPYEARARGIRKNILETLRVEAKWAPQDATIFPYALIQDNPYDFYNEVSSILKTPDLYNKVTSFIFRTPICIAKSVASCNFH